MTTYLDEAASLQAQINELHKKQAALIKEHTTEVRAELAKGEWCRGLKVRYEAGFKCAGLPGHILHFYSSDEPLLKKADLGLSGYVTMWGTHTLYENNVLLRKDRNSEFAHHYTFETSNVKSLCSFIEEAGLVVDLDKGDVLLFETLLANRVK